VPGGYRVTGRWDFASGCGHASWIGAHGTVVEPDGVDAIFPGSPFERRFRDIHTVSQQIQSRNADYETIGQVLLGQPPEVFL